MLQGIYRAFRRREEVVSTEPTVFVHNIQTWLSIFAFSTGAATVLSAIGGWLVINDISLPLFIAGMTFVGILGISLIIVVIYSIVQLVRMLWRGWRGIPYEFNPDKEEMNVIAAITPIEDGASLEEYKIVWSRLVEASTKAKGRLKRDIEKRIAEYSAIINKLEKHNHE